LSDKDVKKYIERIVKHENLKITDEAINSIIEISEGDLRKVSNILQACAALKEKIDEDVVYDVVARAKPKEVREMLELVIKGKFNEAREILQRLLLYQGLSGADIITEIHRQIYSLNISEEDKVKLVEKCGEYEFRIDMGANELIQLEALLAQFLLIGKKN
jgi:replication factor C small subunit